jgi:hypothetical protein
MVTFQFGRISIETGMVAWGQTTRWLAIRLGRLLIRNLLNCAHSEPEQSGRLQDARALRKLGPSASVLRLSRGRPMALPDLSAVLPRPSKGSIDASNDHLAFQLCEDAKHLE